MFDSKKYWNNRYVKGGNSGAGSYNNLAQFKGDVINNFIEKNEIKSIVDYGVGDGNQLKLINTEKLIYTGIDVSEFIISKCKEEFKDDKTKTFIHADNIDNELKAELVLSCDVIYHLVEEHVYKEYMDNLFSMSKKYVIIYAPNINYDEIVHVKKREFIEYIFDNYSNFNLVKRIKKNIGCPFYIFQKNDTYNSTISKNILQVTKENPIDTILVDKIKKNLDGYAYYWFNDENMYKYIQNNQLEEFPNIINHIKSLTKGQHKADIFRYYWLYLNGGIFMDDDLMIEKNINFNYNTFVSVKSYHTNKNILFNGFIACSKFNPIIYKALKQTYFTSNTNLLKNYHLFCSQLYNIYQKLNQNQNTFLLQEKKSSEFIEGVKIYYNDDHLLTHWCYSKNIKTSDNSDLYNGTSLSLIKKDITYDTSWDWNNYKKEEKDNFDYTILNTYKTNKNLVRIGPKNDGGYVIVKEIDYDLYLSCGLAGNTGFDNTILKMYPHLKAYGFDGYIDKLPNGTNKNLKFIKKNISDFDDDKNTTLKEYLTNYNNILLQIDIEGAEFKWLNCLSTENISKFSQILLEVHWPFDNFRFNALKKLNDTHYLVHIHGNNYCNRDFQDKDIGRSYDGKILINNPNLTPIFLPEVMELTYIRKNLVNNIEKINYNFPRNFDNPNNPNTKDIEFKIPDSRIPIYISLTSIFKNQDILLKTLESIMKQTKLPDKIFLYLSEEPYLLDTGFKDKKITNSNLLKFINDNSIIEIGWVKNRGSYRKLLPLLRDKWDEDCIIITIDDDTVYDTHLIENLINDYNEQKCVIGYRGFTPLFDKIENFDYLKHDKTQHLSSYNFFTGKGGILYKPQFFHKTHDLIFNDKIYLDTCPTGDDIWFYIVRLLNNVKGYVGNKNWQIKDLTRDGLFVKFNNKNKLNNKSFKNTFDKLKELEYKFS